MNLNGGNITGEQDRWLLKGIERTKKLYDESAFLKVGTGDNDEKTQNE